MASLYKDVKFARCHCVYYIPALMALTFVFNMFIFSLPSKPKKKIHSSANKARWQLENFNKVIFAQECVVFMVNITHTQMPIFIATTYTV